jgi:Rps23 Pro-64 3,4-dihydroxylase Tpa1-like proline 4-hydroxylase
MTANPQHLEWWGDRLRAEGRLDEAALVYQELLAAEPAHLKASRIISSITGRESSLQSAPGGLKAAPFAMIHQFLEPAVRDALHLGLLSKSCELLTAATTKGVHLDYRRSNILPDCFRHVAPELGQAFYARFLAQWPEARQRLRIAEFEPSLSETHALFYGDGDFFAPHNDTGSENTRRVTFVYNLHRTPRTFEGGDLLLYDTYFRPSRENHNTEEPCFAETYTRLIPEDNRLVVFPSEFYHEVTRVSYKGMDPAGERISITGWVHTTRENGDLDCIASTPY